MPSYDFYRFLVVHFRLRCSDPRVWVGEKRRQLFDGDLPVHYLLWVIQALYLCFPMFVPLSCTCPSLITEPHAAERVHVVWQPTPQSRRSECKAYVACVVILFGYLGVVAVLFYGRLLCLGSGGVYYLQNSRPDLLPWRRQRRLLYRSEAVSQPCAVELRLASSLRSPFIQLLTGWYSFVTAFLTGMFLWPVMRNAFQNNRARRLAVRTLWAALIALTTSCVNILVLTLMHGRQLGWVCLASCGTDVSSRIYSS